MSATIAAIGKRARLPACAVAILALAGAVQAATEPQHSAELDAMIVKAAKRHGVPERLVRRIVMRESRYNPSARNHKYWGLMQISYPTARSMGFKGSPQELLNPLVNLTYAVPYLANAFIAAGKREDAAVRLYASGYYATAKNMHLLGDLRTAQSSPLNGIRDETIVAAAEPPSEGFSLFGSSAPAPVAPAPPPAPAPQQLAYAATPEAAPSPAAAQIQAFAPAHTGTSGKVRTSDKNADGTVAMIENRDGSLAPPKRWQHDGGTSVVAKGEQGLESMAAAKVADGGTLAQSRHRSRKIAVYAELAPGGPQKAAATQVASDAEAVQQQTRMAAAQEAAQGGGQRAVQDPADPRAGGDATETSRHATRHHRHASRTAHAKAPSATVAELRQ